MTTPRPPGRASRWLAGRTLRTRLLAGLLALLALACATVGLLTYTHLHTVLINQLDTELTTASLRYSGCFSPHPPGGDDDGAPPAGQPSDRGAPPSECAQQQMTAAFTAVISQPGTVSDPYLAGSSGLCYLAGADAAAVASVPAGRFVTVNLTSYGAYR
ncbi:MAG: hypothetical protein WBH47_08380, partial [Streptosporangiaceae bacterium]